MVFFLKIFLAHLLGDFVFQTTRMVEDKNKKSYLSLYLYIHILIHFVILLIFLGLNFWFTSICIVLSHLVIDVLKVEMNKKEIFNHRILFFIDQMLHIMVLLSVTMYHHSIGVILSRINLNKEYFYMLFVCLVLITQVSSIVIKHLMSYWNLSDDAKDDSLKDAGKYIGMLERLMVFGFIISGQTNAVGYLLAAKSVLRFNDLTRAKDRKLTEYILIGTMLSFSMAIIVAWGYLLSIRYFQ